MAPAGPDPELPADEELERLRGALSDKQRAFCERYFANGFSAREAAEYAGYGDPVAQAWRVKSHPAVTAYIEYRLGQMTMTANEALAHLNQRASYCVEDFFDFKEGHPVFKPEKARDRGVLHLIEGFEYDKRGNLIVKLPNKGEAVALIGKNQKLFTERVDITTGIDIDSLTREQLEAVAAGKSPS